MKKELELDPLCFPNAEDYQNDFDTSTQVLLGSGSYGQVYKMTSKSNPKQQSAVKIVQCTNEKAYSQALKEVQLNRLINIHPNIIFFDKIYAWSETIPVLKYFLVFSMKLAQGSLKDLKEEEINEKRKNFNEPVFINIVQQLLSTFHFLQNKELYHRDIKPENILYEKEGDKIIIRITDFGVSKALHHLKIINIKNTLVGTPLYLSPKLWDAYLNGQYNDVKHNLEKSDVFSLGITLLQTYLLLPDAQISGLNDSKQNKLPETLQKIQNDKIRDLLSGMLQYDEKQRFTWQQAVNILNFTEKNNKSFEQALGSLNTKEQRYALPISYEKTFANKSQTMKLKMISQIFNFESQDNIKGQLITKDVIYIFTDHQVISINFDGTVQFQKTCLNLQKLCFIDSIELLIGLFSDNTLQPIDQPENQYKVQGTVNALCKLKNEMVGVGLQNGEVQLIQVSPQFKIMNTFHDHTAQINLIHYDAHQDVLITADLSRIFSVRYLIEKQFSYLKLDYVVQHADMINDQQIVVNGQQLSEILILQIENTKNQIKLESKYTLNLQTSTVLSLINLSERCLFVSTEKEFIIYDITLLPSEQGHLYKNDTSLFQLVNWELNHGYLFTNDGFRIIKWQIEYNQNQLFGCNRKQQQVQKKCCCCASPCQIM